jgi:hypothetical protein
MVVSMLEVDYATTASTEALLARLQTLPEKHSDVPRRMHHTFKAVGSSAILLTSEDINASYIQDECLL